MSVYNGYDVQIKQVEWQEVDFIKTNDTVLPFNDTHIRGVFSAELNELPLSGIWDYTQKAYINMTFVECQQSGTVLCKTQDEIEAFLQANYLTIFTAESFIDFDSVLPLEETQQKFMKVEYFDIVSTLKEKSKTYHKRLKEFNAELHDDRLNFMGLGSVKEIV